MAERKETKFSPKMFAKIGEPGQTGQLADLGQAFRQRFSPANDRYSDEGTSTAGLEQSSVCLNY